jgi:cytoskeletal protein RodZ
MTEQTPNPDSYDKPEPKRRTGNVPPLTWVVLVLLLGVIVYGAMQRRQTHVTPQGGTTPSAVEGQTYMPAAPATPEAPATPSSTTSGER